MSNFDLTPFRGWAGASLVGVALLAAAQPADAGIVVNYFGSDGLAAEAEFTMLDATTLEVRLRNISTGVPAGFDSADQILTGVSWDFGDPGFNGDNSIAGGTVFTGPTSSSINFSITNVGPNEDVSGEWAYGNMNGTGMLTNFFSANIAEATPFGGANLDGPENIDGPQGGLVANPVIVPLGGLGAIQDEVIATLTLANPYTQFELLSDLLNNGTTVEFGSDAAFVTGQIIPAPGALPLLAVVALAHRRRRRA